MTVRAVCLLAAMLFAHAASGHRLSPAYFGMTETAPGEFAAQWKVSISGGLADALEPRIPDGCRIDGTVRSFNVDDARVQHASLICEGSLAGREFRVEGLPLTDTDVLFRLDYLDGASFTHRLVPDAPAVLIPAEPGAAEVAGTYFVLGVEHILLGIDHLLFVLALLLLVRGWGRLVATITAFTLAHSLTLAAATLGYVHVPSAPVEATIALSILFLATELARRELPGTREQSGETLSVRFPWVVAFSFGLLHGFGFAGALSEVGLPDRAIPLALLFFNVGVEAGQLLFVAAFLGLSLVLAAARIATPAWTARATAYLIGGVASYWVVERTLSAI